MLVFLWKYLCPIVTNQCKFYEDVMHEGMGRGEERKSLCLFQHIKHTFLMWLPNIFGEIDALLYYNAFSHIFPTPLTLSSKPRPQFTFHLIPPPPPPILSLLYLSFSNLCSSSMKCISWLVTNYCWIKYNLQIRVF